MFQLSHSTRAQQCFPCTSHCSSLTIGISKCQSCGRNVFVAADLNVSGGRSVDRPAALTLRPALLCLSHRRLSKIAICPETVVKDWWGEWTVFFNHDLTTLPPPARYCVGVLLSVSWWVVEWLVSLKVLFKLLFSRPY